MHFLDDLISNEISFKFITEGPIYNKPTLVHVIIGVQ